jgi:hypothetical protein
MGSVTLHTPGTPWPFKDMEVGDIVISMDPKARAYAHSYGQGTSKRFLTRVIKSKTGVQGWKVVRMSDNALKLKGIKGMGRPRKEWEFDHLLRGEHWICTDSEAIPRTLSAVHRANKKHRQLTGNARYATTTRIDQAAYASLTITRID